MPAPVEVNFNVLIDADSSVTVLGEAAPTVSNVVIAEKTLGVECLYDSANKKGLIEMYEPADAPGDIKVALAKTDSSANGGDNLNGAAVLTVARLADGLQKVLCDKLDAVAAAPFNDAKYSGVVEYTKQRDFGRLALGALSHYFFGHVDATAAITNDEDFVKSMLSVSAGHNDETSAGAAARYAAWAHKNQVSAVMTATNLQDAASALGNWQAIANPTGSASDANLAERIALSIYKKGLDSNNSMIETSVNSASADSLANIVKQVIGQDASRTKDVDGSERTKDVRQLLRFYAGDVIYVNIKVKAPSVTVGTGQVGVSSSSLLASYATEQNYTIKVTLA